ncbi:Defective in cullin neddylation protein AAR3-like protein [Drosera capensis]
MPDCQSLLGLLFLQNLLLLCYLAISPPSLSSQERRRITLKLSIIFQKNSEEKNVPNVLSFFLSNKSCQKNQRHNISEDTWRQVLAFSRCVHEDLEGYDSAGAWPVLIDDFVEHMYRITGSNKSVLRDAACSCNDGDGKPYIVEDSLPGLKRCPGLKRKLSDDLLNFYSSPLDGSVFSVFPSKCRKSEKQWTFHKDRRPLSDSDDLQGIAKQISSFSIGPSCAVEGYLSKGFAGLLSSWPSVHLDQEMQTSWQIE